MDRFITVAAIVAPIFAAIVLGMRARRKQWVTAENIQGFQTFVMKIGLPCAIFNSCLIAQIGAESVSSMALALPTVLLGALWAFRFGRKTVRNTFVKFRKGKGVFGVYTFSGMFSAENVYCKVPCDFSEKC